MGLRINKAKVSTRSWGEIDKGALRQRLADEAKADLAAAKAASAEAMAHLVGEQGIDALLHHEITGDGEVVLSKGGLTAATAALVGSQGELATWAPADKRAAATHLVAHYRQEGMGLMPPHTLLQMAGELPAGEMHPVLAGEVAGEMAVEAVALAPWTKADTVQTLGGEQAMEVVVKVPVGKSKRGWHYTAKALQDIVGEVNTNGLPARLGHQKAEDVATEFFTPVTHWIGARFDAQMNAALFRGVVDKAATDLRRWIKGRAIREVSIFGMPTLATVGGEQHVVGYKALSIDWTPLNRPGMPTEIVAIAGEMADADVITPNKVEGGPAHMDWKKMAQDLLAAIRGGHTTWAQVAGEMGVTEAEALQILQRASGEQHSLLTGSATVVGEMVVTVGLEQGAKPGDVLQAVKAVTEAHKVLTGEMAGVATALGLGADAKPADVKAKAVAVAKTITDQAETAHTALVDGVVGEMVVAESARPMFRLIMNAHIPDLAKITTKDALKKAVGEMIEKPEVKTAMAATFREGIMRTKQDEAKGTENKSGLVATRRSI